MLGADRDHATVAAGGWRGGWRGARLATKRRGPHGDGMASEFSEPRQQPGDTPGADSRATLTRTKLRPPRLPARLVASARHAALADAVLAHGVTLVRAPSGYGKSTLASGWHRSVIARGHIAAWVSFEPEDDAPARAIGAILQALASALTTREAVVLHHLAGGLLANDGVIVPQAVATRLINAVDEIGERVVLFLDDIDRLTDPRILQFLNYLLLHAPANLHVVLATQARLALPLVHLDHHGQLLRIGIDEMRLSDAEAADLLAAGGATLSKGDVRRLNAAMAGWVTGLRIGSAALRNNRDALLDVGLAGHGARWLSDYLDDNIVRHLTPDAQVFLSRCAVVASMTPELATALSGLPDAGPMLGWLADQNLFVQRQGEAGDWFQIHAAFRGFLLDRLAREDAAAVPRLHGVASRWYAAHGRPAEAIGHALDAGDADAAAALIEGQAQSMVEQSDILTLLGWIARLPVAAIEHRIPLRLAQAWALTLSLRPQARAVLDDLYSRRRAKDDALDRELAGIETIFLAVYEDRLDAALEHGRTYLAGNATDSFTSRAVRNAAAYCELARGNHAEVHALVRPAQLQAQRAEQIFPTAYRYAVVGLGYRNQGQLAEAERTFAAGLDLARRVSGPGSASSALLAPLLARCRYEAGDLDAAAALLDGQLPVIDEACFSETVLNAYLIAVRLAAPRDAAALIEHAELLGHERGWARLQALCMVERARLGLPQTMAADDLVAEAEEAAAIAAPLGLKARTFAILWKYRAEMALATGDRARLTTITTRVATLAHASGQHELLLKSHVYALLPKLMGTAEVALPAVCAGLARDAVAAGYRRTFTDILEAPVRGRLTLPPEWPPELAVLVRPPRAAPAPASPRTVFELLTSREIDVLTGVSTGHSNKDIARQLQLTPETVKWHLKNVMRKLGADSRTEAVRAAAALGLSSAG